MYLIYLSPVPWSSPIQRPHEVARYFHMVTGGRVIWINPYPARFPRVQDHLRLELKGSNHDFPDWLEVYTPSSLPYDLLPLGPQIGRSFFWRGLQDSLERIGARGKALVIGVGKPSTLAIGVLRQFRDASSFFDVMDEIPAYYKGLSRRNMVRMEKEVLDQVGRVFVSSASLLRRLKSMGAQPVLLRNGCAADRMPQPRPADWPGSRTLGFVGTIGEWFDWEITVKLAQAVPWSRIVIVGPLYLRPPRRLPPNIVLEPPCSHEKALARMKGFEIGLIPFRQTRLTDSADPIKYYEYRAMGLAVLSTVFGGMVGRDSDPGTFFLTNGLDFVPTVSAACSHRDTPEAITRFRRENSWETRFSSAGLFSWLC